MKLKAQENILNNIPNIAHKIYFTIQTVLLATKANPNTNNNNI